VDREASVAFAKKYLEDVLSFFGINATAEVVSSSEVIELNVSGSELSGFLIGRGGETLRSLQQITSAALRARDAELARVSIDIADYKKQRADRLAGDVENWARAVLETGKPFNLKPMNASDRRTVHRVVDAISGLRTHSEGEGRERHIIISRNDSTTSLSE
jgi:spoIIIJ-associated protein